MNPSPRDNFYRCMTLIVDNGNEAAWDLLDYYLSKQGTTLKDFIQKNQHEIYHLCYNYGGCCRCQYGTVNKPKSRILYQSQLDILLDTKGSNMPCTVHVRSNPTCSQTVNDHYPNPNTSTNQLDLTLCRCLLINFTNILPYGSVERAAFEDLINMRNKCCHAAKGEISSKDYQTYKAQIEQCLLSLAQIYGKTHNMTLAIKDAEKRPLDESIRKQLQQTILQEQVLQGVSGLHKHIESSQEAEERTSMEIQKMGKSTKRTLQAVNLSLKSTGHTASKIQKLEETSKRTLMVVKSSKKSVDHTASKIKKLEENTETKLQTVENSAGNIEKKIEESSERTILAVESSQKSVEHSSANIEKKLEENSERTIQAVESSQQSTATKIQKLEERLSKCDLTETEINNHLTEETFVETPAVDACITFLETNSLLVITGAAGSGKSRNSLDILNKFRIQHPEYETIKLTELHDFTDIVTSDGKLVILFEDVFGRTNTRFTENTDIQIIDSLQACLNQGNVKAILIVRDTIKVSCQRILTLHKIFNGKCEVDLSSVDFKMSRDKKESLLLNYFKKFNLRVISLNEDENYFKEEILKENIPVTLNHKTLYSIIESEPLLGFPEACSLFTRNRKLTRLGIKFFNHPSRHLYDEIDKIRKNGRRDSNDRLLYVTLVYLLLNGDVLDENCVDTTKGMDIMKSCYGSQQDRLLACDIIDAAADMKGRYLTYRPDTFRYHFQHQTVLESVMISYSKIEQEVVISMVSFDFIREMVRLQHYRENEGEVFMKVSQTLYEKLAERIIEILQSQYFKKALTFNLQLLCDMQIIREDNEYFITSLLTASHNAYMCSDYNLETDILVESSFRKFKLYFPAAFLEYVGRQTGMHTSLICIFDNLRSILLNETNDDLLHVCKYSLLQTFFDICEKDSENLLEAAWGVLKLFISFTKHYEYFQNIIDKACISCPITTLEWMFKTFDKEIFEGRRMLLNACQYKRLNSVKFMFKSFKHETFDFNEILIAVVKNVRKESNTEVLQCLLENVKSSSSEMSKSILSVCEIIWPNDMDALLKNADPSLFDSKSILKRAVRNRRKGSLECLVKWIITNVNPNILDLTEIMNIVCVLQVLEIGKLLIHTIENSLLDVNVIMIAAIQKNWEGEHESFILWLISHIDLALFNFKTIEAEACKNGKLDEIKLLLSKTDHNLFDLGKIMQNACEHGKLDIVQYLLSDDDRTKLQVDTAIVSACSTGHLHIVKYVIKNCDLVLLNIKLAMQKAVVCGQHEIVAWLLFNCDHDMFDISNLMNKACSFGWLDIVKWLFEKIDISLFDMLMAIHEACNKCHIELIEFLIENVRFSEDSLKSVMTLSCFRGNIDIVKLLLHKQNDDCHMYDMRVAMNDACSGGRIELVQWLLKSSNRHDKFDMEFVLKWVCINEHLNLATWIFDNIDHSSISWSSLFHWVCSKGHIASMNFLLQKIDNKLLNFKTALTDTCIEGHLNVVHRLFEIHRFSLIEVKHAMNECIRFEHAIINKWIMQNIGINANDIKMTLEWTQENNNIRLMTFLVLNIDITDTINILCSKGHFELIQWILLNVHAPLLDFNILMNEASRHGRLDIVKNIFGKVHDNSEVLKKALKCSLFSGHLNLFKWLLDNIEESVLNIQSAIDLGLFDGRHDLINWLWCTVDNLHEAMTSTCSEGDVKSVKWLLDNIDNNVFDMEIAVNHSIIEGNFELFKFLILRIKSQQIDINSTFSRCCLQERTEFLKWTLKNNDIALCNLVNALNETSLKKNYNLIECMLTNTSHSMKEVMNYSCLHGFFYIVTWMLENTHHSILDILGAFDIIYNTYVNRYDKGDINDRSNAFEPFIKLILRKVENDLVYMKKVLNLACRYGSLHVVHLVLEHTDHKNLDVKEAMNIVYNSWKFAKEDTEKDESKKYEHLMKLILSKVNHDFLNLNEVLNQACRSCSLNIVRLILENTDHQKLKVKGAMNIAFNSLVYIEKKHSYIDTKDRTEKYESLIKSILEKVNFDSLDLTLVLNQACRYGCLDIVKYVLENSDHKSLYIMEAFSIIYSSIMDDDDGMSDQRKKYEPLIKLILDKANHDSLDFKVIVHKACWYCFSDVITFVLHNTDHDKLEIMEAVNILFSRIWNEDDDIDDIDVKREKFEPLILIILGKVYHELLDIKKIMNKACSYGCLDVVTFILDKIDLKECDIIESINIVSNPPCLNNKNHDSIVLEIMYKACCYGYLDVVTFALENTDHKRLNIMVAVNIVYSSIIDDYDDNDIHDSRGKYEPLIRQILKKVNHDLLDLKTVFYQAFGKRCLDVVSFLLENTDQDKLDVKGAMNTAIGSLYCASFQMGKNGSSGKEEILIELILEKVNHDSLVLKEIMNYACCKGYLDVVKYLLENTDHEKLEIMESVNDVYSKVSIDEYYDDDMNDQRGKYEPLIIQILEKVNHDLLDLKKVSIEACRTRYLEVVTYLLEHTDHDKLDVKKAVNTEMNSKFFVNFFSLSMRIDNKRKMAEPLIKLILEKVNHGSLPLKEIMNYGCYNCCLNVVRYLLENIDHDQLDVKGAVDDVYDCVIDIDYYDKDMNNLREKYEPLIRHILEKVNHDLLDLITIFHLAWRIGCVEVVTYLLENTNHDQLDVKEEVNDLYRSVADVDYDYDCMNNLREKYEPLIRHILEKVNHDLLDLKTIFHLACLIGSVEVVTYLLENINHDQLDVRKAVNYVCHSVYIDDDDVINKLRERYDPLIRHILEKVNHDLLDLKTIFVLACSLECLEVVAYLLENINHDQVDVKEAVNDVFRSVPNVDYNNDGINSQREKCALLIRHILEKVNHDLLDLKTIFVLACSLECLEVVAYLLENINHDQVDVKEAVNDVFRSVSNVDYYNDGINSQREKYALLIRHILEKVNHDLLDLKTIFVLACSLECLEVVAYLLENINHDQVDVKEAVNDVFRSVSYVDYCNDGINSQREKYALLIRHILEKVNHDLLDLKTIFVLACSLECLEVVAYLLENNNHDQVDVKEAVNDVFRSVSYVDYCNDGMNSQRENCALLIRHILEKVNHDLLDLKTIFHLACSLECLKAVAYLLENINHDQLDVKEAVNYVFRSVSNVDYYNDGMNSQREKYALWFRHILEKVNHDLLDLKTIFHLACRIECLEVVTYLLENINHDTLDIMEALNKVFDSKREYLYIHFKRERNDTLLKLFLEKVNSDLLDLKKIFNWAFGYCCLDIVTYLLENTDHKNLNIMETVRKALYPSIYEDTVDNFYDMISSEEVIKLLLQKVKTDLFDMEVLMNIACRKEWLDIVRWLVENVAHSMFDIDTSMNVLMRHSTENNLAIFKLLLKNISQSLFNIRSVIEQASHLNHTEKVLWILQTKDNTLFDIKYVMNEACRNSNLLLIKYVMENIDRKCFDVRSAMNKACRSSETNSLGAVKWLFENIPHNMLDLENAMNNACRYDNVLVVEWFWNNLDRKLFNVKSAWNNACYNCNEALLSYLLNNMDKNMLINPRHCLRLARILEKEIR